MRGKDRAYWAILLFAILAVALIRVHLLDVPLERDEGEYAYAGRLILQGIPPYAAAYNMKLPGMYAAYAVILKIFGESISAIRTGLIIVNALTAVFIFSIGRRLFDPLTGVLASSGFLVLSLSSTVLGIFAHAEHFVIFFALAGLLLLLEAVRPEGARRWMLFASGLLLGASYLMKQHGVFFIIFSLFFLILNLRRKPGKALSLISFSSGAVLPFGLTCLMLYGAGVFDRFWFWTFTYASEYASSVPLERGMLNLRYFGSTVTGSSLLLGAFAGVGLLSFLWDKRVRKNYLFVLFLFLFSFGAVSVGLYFREHYFVMLLPASALLFGMGMGSVWGLFSRARSKLLRTGPPLALALASLALPIYGERDVLFFSSPEKVSHKIYGLNPFPESVPVARYIRENSAPGDRVAVLGSEPQIYFYSERTSATSYIYTYPLMETHPYALDMQKEMVSQIEEGRPLFIVFVNARDSWIPRGGSKLFIFDWFTGYAEKHYELVGFIDIISRHYTDYYWGESARTHSPISEYWVAVYKRKDIP